MRTYMERTDFERRMARFYAVTVTPTLFGEWSVLREWGRIGQGGTVREADFATEQEALAGANTVIRFKSRRGYRAR